jgi:hypothetical protein
VFQKEQVLTGDFYSQWLKCESETEKVRTAFAKSLSACLKNRVQQLTKTICSDRLYFETRGVLVISPCIVFFIKNLFFRYKLLLNDEQKNLAIVHLCKFWAHFSSLTDSTTEDLVPSISTKENSRESHNTEYVDSV